MLFVLVTIIAVLFGSVRSQTNVNDQCNLRDGSEGICKNYLDCPQARKDFRNGVFTKICSSKGFKRIVCCKELKSASILKTAANDSPKEPSPFVQKEFLKACKSFERLPKPYETFIIGGKRTHKGEFPHMVVIGYRDSYLDEIEFKCGGSIISSKYVLTAAHCSRRDLEPLFVRAGTISIARKQKSTNFVDYQIETFIKHPAYNAKLKKNDIALMRLKEIIKFTEYVRPACLQTDGKDLPIYNMLYVVGWGWNGTQYSDSLLKTKLTTMERATCNTTLLDFAEGFYHPSISNGGIDRSRYCAYDPTGKNDACQGDSGGPLQTLQFGISTIVGVISFGFECANGLPAIYSRVAVYLDWIYSVVGSTEILI